MTPTHHDYTARAAQIVCMLLGEDWLEHYATSTRDYVAAALADVATDAREQAWLEIVEYFKDAEEALGITGFSSNAIAKARALFEPPAEAK